MAAKKNTVTAPAAPAADIATATPDTTTATPDTTTAPASTARPDGPAGVVWDAVTANPGGTVPVIANAAGVARAVAKAELIALATSGRVVCTPGGRGDNGRALPDTWAPAPDTTIDTATASTADAAEATVPQAPAVTAEAIAEAMRIMQAEADRRAAAEADLQKAMAEEEARRAKVLADLARARTAEDTRRALADLLAAVTTAYAAVVAGDQVATVAGLERIYAEANNVRKASKVGPVRTGAKGTGAVRADRAAPRPLRPEVVAHLSAHPGKEFTPGEIAKVLGRSSGAVANALETLAKNGEAVLTSERPARYTAPTTTTATGTAATGTAAGDGDVS
ncbi:hypothetical protein SAMN04489712_104140 [Thermomonospora echinospora]|uniref:Uncharacterized protein n=1 Tax=Thermomonospora echinospora TaxID=1992 RepID=A0A1H5YR04_9ACTN|nr:hypothetical protein [Thermomonospora echinospora]SEG26569.1 hypothetical protein SAMN04489712_104140 [Thermomonospora echinospora]